MKNKTSVKIFIPSALESFIDTKCVEVNGGTKAFRRKYKKLLKESQKAIRKACEDGLLEASILINVWTKPDIWELACKRWKKTLEDKGYTISYYCDDEVVMATIGWENIKTPIKL